jgi:Secretion system C-terminal sorting domain
MRYDLPNNGFVSLKIYDALGREIASLVNNEQGAGIHDVVWNARDFSTGIYFCKLEAGEYSATKKIVLVK